MVEVWRRHNFVPRHRMILAETDQHSIPIAQSNVLVWHRPSLGWQRSSLWQLRKFIGASWIFFLFAREVTGSVMLGRCRFPSQNSRECLLPGRMHSGRPIRTSRSRTVQIPCITVSASTFNKAMQQRLAISWWFPSPKPLATEKHFLFPLFAATLQQLCLYPPDGTRRRLPPIRRIFAQLP